MNHNACLDCEAGLACIAGVVEYDDAFMESRAIIYLTYDFADDSAGEMHEITELEGWRAETCPQIAKRFA